MVITPDWRSFAVAAVLVLVVLTVLARRSDPEDASPKDDAPEAAVLLVAALLHVLVGATLVAAAWLTHVPSTALGVAATPAVWDVAVAGVGSGVLLYGLDELGTGVVAALGTEPAAPLRGLFAPTTQSGWAVLLLAVLPVVAAAEELLYRGALVGAFAAGFGVSPWLLAVGSSLAFGLAHDVQGGGGVVVTGLLGFALAAIFVMTGSLLVVVVAHYVVNVLEVVVHEGFGVEWA